MKGTLKESLSEEGRLRYSNSAYEKIAPINNTVSLFVSTDKCDNPKGSVFILDRDTLLIKEEGFVTMKKSEFLEALDVLLVQADAASWCNDFRYSGITMISVGMDKEDCVFDLKSKSVNDSNVLKEFNKASFSTTKDIVNLLKIHGVNSL